MSPEASSASPLVMAGRAAPRVLTVVVGVVLVLVHTKLTLVLGVVVLVLVLVQAIGNGAGWLHYLRTGERNPNRSTRFVPDLTGTRGAGYAAQPGEVRVVLESVGTREINVMKVLRQTTGEDLASIKTKVQQAETVGTVVAEGLSQASADRLVELLTEQGARARTV